MSPNSQKSPNPSEEHVSNVSRAPSTAVNIFDSNPVDVRYSKRQSIYYSVTEPEIEVYAQFGWLATIFLTLFGASAGFSLGCVTALLQGNIPTNAHNALVMSSIVTGTVSAVFLIISITLIIR